MIGLLSPVSWWAPLLYLSRELRVCEETFFQCPRVPKTQGLG